MHIWHQYYAENNLDRAADYAKGVLDAMGYTAVLETVSGYGHNVVATKIGTVYPNIYIEFGAHLDTKPGTPGGNDNGSGSAAVMELARVLKDYPSRYSMTFALWVGEETGGFAGAYYHIDQMLAAGKQIKAGLNLDNMGQIGAGNIYRNDVWTNNAASLHIWDIFNQVNTQYSLGLTLVNNANRTACSDGHAYWATGADRRDERGRMDPCQSRIITDAVTSSPTSTPRKQPRSRSRTWPPGSSSTWISFHPPSPLPSPAHRACRWTSTVHRHRDGEG